MNQGEKDQVRSSGKHGRIGEIPLIAGFLVRVCREGREG